LRCFLLSFHVDRREHQGATVAVNARTDAEKTGARGRIKDLAWREHTFCMRNATEKKQRRIWRCTIPPEFLWTFALTVGRNGRGVWTERNFGLSLFLHCIALQITTLLSLFLEQKTSDLRCIRIKRLNCIGTRFVNRDMKLQFYSSKHVGRRM